MVRVAGLGPGVDLAFEPIEPRFEPIAKVFDLGTKLVLADESISGEYLYFDNLLAYGSDGFTKVADMPVYALVNFFGRFIDGTAKGQLKP